MHIKRIHLDSIDSTNRILSQRVKSGPVREEVAVIADYQESGKGQGDHHWHSNPGESLLMSVLLYPAFLSASGQFHLTRIASLAILDTLKSLGLAPSIKWPNDLLSRDKKIAGILIENGIMGENLSHSIIGMGLNLYQERFPEFPFPATSLVLESGTRKESLQVADMLLEAIGIRYEQLKSGQADLLEKEYMEHLFLLDRPAGYTSGGVKFQGTIRGVNQYGELLVEKDGKTVSYGFQEIQYLVTY